jgi:hypothetical protein
MCEISKFCKLYCNHNHIKWAEIFSKIEESLNTKVADSTGLFEKILTKSPENLPEAETIGDNVMKAYARMRKKAKDRRERRKTGNKTWETKVNEKFLMKAQPASDAAVGVTAKFIHPYEGPYITSKLITPSTYGLSTASGKVRG